MRNSSFADRALLTRTADHALRALILLARRASGEPIPAGAIAELTGTPPNYMGKTLHALARAGLVHGTRGPAGGFVLTVPPDSVTIAQVADMFGDAPSTRRCLLGSGHCDPTAPCVAHRHWVRVANAARKPLVTTTIADLLADAVTVEPESTDGGVHLPSGAAGL